MREFKLRGLQSSPMDPTIPARRDIISCCVVALVEGWMVLLETAVVAVDGLGTCLFCDVDVTFRGRPLFRSGATGEVLCL
ncbi:hypothetical protein TNCV_1042301 [Trichonephila clavipes]|nr:hypothetical protein TNCV_1042301 [Trichonephila clavipes]